MIIRRTESLRYLKLHHNYLVAINWRDDGLFTVHNIISPKILAHLCEREELYIIEVI
jgi:hypothetical protein